MRKTAEADAETAKKNANDHIASLEAQRKSLSTYIEDIRALLSSSAESLALQKIVENSPAHDSQSTPEN